jgi:hypothetical protein
MNKDKTFSIVANTLGTIQSLSRLGEREFGQIFYNLKDNVMDTEYLRSKYNYYCEEGFIKAYNRLDVRNCNRVLDYITEEVHTEQVWLHDLEEGVKND